MLAWTLLLFVAAASAQFDGLGEYLCGYYDGDEDICPDPNAPKEYGPICMTVCRSCDDDFVKNYVDTLVSGNPNPPTGELANVSEPLIYGNPQYPLVEYPKCDTSFGYSMVFKEQIQFAGQLNFIEFYVGSSCQVSNQKGIKIGIFREYQQSTSGICSYKLISMVTISKTTISGLLGGRTTGLVHYTLEPAERIQLVFDKGDHVGIIQPGSGIISFDSITVDRLCMENVGPWTVGNGYILTTPDLRAKRQYAIRVGYMPW